ncbi:MAG: glycosyltransferase [Alphaproteobacteria bacterium]|nr:glycosyltransferase [Alphaproteobacteria bacterium]MBV9860855.1 glycosyltransferase [Alphaproteobacteria bacterium]
MRTLYLDANGVGSRMLVVDTVLRGMFGYRDGDRPPAPLRRFGRVNALFSELRDVYAQLSYAADWRDAFVASPQLAVEVCNINNLVHFGRCLMRLRSYDLIVVSHAAAGDDMTLLLRAAPWFDRRRAPMAVFIGNEYDLLDDKIAFIRQTEAEFVCSQLPLTAAGYLYAECDKARIVEMPHALNPQSYHPLPDVARDIDIGFIGDIYWPFVGDRERTDAIEWFERNGAERGLRCDIRKQRVGRDAWCRFLNGCNAIVGAESGTYYLNDRGRLLERARAYNLFENRAATFDEVFDRFYRDQPRAVSGKSISSRHFEPIGTKTCQILIAGEYNGILEADRHYIALNKDLSNTDEALRRFHDGAFRTRMVEDTYDYVMSRHTYAHRVERLLQTVAASPVGASVRRQEIAA